MKAIIISIGDELLIGQTVNTNASWIAQEINKIGIQICEVITVADSKKHIIDTIKRARQDADIILITGGLGPTNDDVTKNALCKYFKSKLILNKTILKDVKNFFEKRNRILTEKNKTQALVPHNCIPIRNSLGTAPGMWFETSPLIPLRKERGGKQIFVSLPGVPFEMKAMVKDFVIPQLKRRFRLPIIIHKNILTSGIGESFLADKIKSWEDELPTNINLAYLPSLGMVKLRLTIEGNDRQKLNKEINLQIIKLKKLIAEYIFGYDDETLETVIGNILKKKKTTVATAESCTGGSIAHLLTSVAGSSAYYKGSVIAYNNDIKISVLKIRLKTIEQFGAVSEQTCKEMLQGILKKFQTDYAIAVTGIAGPGGGTKDKPVGTVWIGVGSEKKFITKKYLFPFSRMQNIEQTTVTALNLLRKILK